MHFGTDYVGMINAAPWKNFINLPGGCMNKLILLIVFFFITKSALAAEEVLAVITNDENQDVFTFVASTDDATQTLKAFYKDDYLNGKRIEREVLPTAKLGNEGIILDKRGEHTVINLRSSDFTTEGGGRVTIDTLYNGVTGERRNYEIEISRDGTGWKITKNDNIVSKLHIEVNKKILIGTIGVKNIRME